MKIKSGPQTRLICENFSTLKPTNGGTKHNTTRNNSLTQHVHNNNNNNNNTSFQHLHESHNVALTLYHWTTDVMFTFECHVRR